MDQNNTSKNWKFPLLGFLLITFIIISFLAFASAISSFNFPSDFNFFSNSNSSAGQNSEQVQSANQDSIVYIVTKVVDGDTIDVSNETETLKIRYIGMDTPETVKPNTAVQCYGKEASNFNKELVLNKKVRLEKDVSDTDRYGRKLRFVYLAEGENNGKMVNEILLLKGYATLDTFPPDVKFAEKFKQDESIARISNIGLWNECK